MAGYGNNGWGFGLGGYGDNGLIVSAGDPLVLTDAVAAAAAMVFIQPPIS